MKVALVHYWLVNMRGGERVLRALCDLYPQADIFALVADADVVKEHFPGHTVKTSFLQKIGGKKHYQKMLPLMPHALESFDLTGYDLVISSESGPAKGVVTRPDSLHVCYCHSPMRYIWDLFPQYYAASGKVARLALSLFAPGLRQWDVTTSARVDHFVANSTFVAQRIKKFYRRDSDIVFPPVGVKRFDISPDVDDYYLCAGQITPYKKIEVAIEACNKLGRRLIIVGDGATKALKDLAGPTIEFTGPAPHARLKDYMARCRALLFPGVEDFGILPLEVMASGRPVIAYGRGGALETIKDGVTGAFFAEQSAASLSEAILAFEAEPTRFDPESIRTHALTFDEEVFKARISAVISTALRERGLSA